MPRYFRQDQVDGAVFVVEHPRQVKATIVLWNRPGENQQRPVIDFPLDLLVEEKSEEDAKNNVKCDHGDRPDDRTQKRRIKSG